MPVYGRTTETCEHVQVAAYGCTQPLTAMAGCTQRLWTACRGNAPEFELYGQV